MIKEEEVKLIYNYAIFKMTDSGSFSSLLALVDNHLSKTSIQDQSEGTTHSLSNHIQIPKLTHQNGAQSDTKLSFSPGQRIGIPTFSFSTSPVNITDVLAQQVSNMLKAKELKKQQEEEQKLMEETRKLTLKEDNCVIDLMQAIRTPYKPETVKEILSSSSSIESLFDPNFSDGDENIPTLQTPEPLLLSCTMDLSYILQQKVRRGRCSNFGKVLSSRIRPVAAPYFRESVKSSVAKFEFDSPSPCDLIKEKLRKPTSYNTYNFNIFDMI